MALTRWHLVAALLAPLVAVGSIWATQQLSGVAEPPAASVPDGDKSPACGSFGTSVEFVDTPREAAKKAKQEQKLVFVLHVSGNFEDPRFT